MNVWKKDEIQGQPMTAPSGQTYAPAPPAPARHDVDHRPEPGGKELATIGPSITIRGDVTGDEDLLIQGRIEGTVDLKQHRVTVGPEGKVKANIVGRSVTVEGEVVGDVRGQEQVVLRKTARVQGNIAAPRVALEEGAVFRGGIDMSDQSERTQPKPAKAVPVVEAPKGEAKSEHPKPEQPKGAAQV